MDGTAANFAELLDMVAKYDDAEYEDVVAKTINELKKESKDISFTAKTLDDLYAGPSVVVTIIVFAIFGIVLIGFIYMIAFSRKN